MGDMGDYWRDVKESSRKYKEKNGWISQQYKTEEERDEWVEHKHELNRDIDQSRLKKLEELGLNPKYKSTSSFMVFINGRQAMYYTGKWHKLHFKDGEKVDLQYGDIEDYLEELNKKGK